MSYWSAPEERKKYHMYCSDRAHTHLHHDTQAIQMSSNESIPVEQVTVMTQRKKQRKKETIHYSQASHK